MEERKILRQILSILHLRLLAEVSFITMVPVCFKLIMNLPTQRSC